MTGGVVEIAAAGYQAQRGEVGRAVNGFRRESRFEVLAHAGNAENGRHPVGERHVDGVARAEGAEPEKDGRPPRAVDMTLDDRRPDLAGCRRVLVPRRLPGTRLERGHLDRAVGVESQVQQLGIHADGRDPHRYRQRPGERGPAGPRPGGARRRPGRLRRVRLGAGRDAHDGGTGRDEQDPGDPGDPGAQASCRGQGGRRRVTGLRPGHDHAEAGDPPPRRVRQFRRPFPRLPRRCPTQ